jgi:UDP:flavonoid glycosyltransferase YjiC (YdhE family)
MLDQATAAIASSDNDLTAAERRHIGQDVATPAAQAAEAAPPIDDVPPPAYGEEFGTITQEQDGFGTKATVGDDGRVNIRINQTNRRLSQLLVPSLSQLQQAATEEEAPPPAYIPPSLGGADGVPPPPPMNVVIQVVGSRGDVQPFVALGKVLKETYGHRVRLATHPNFKDFVIENDLEFFSIGGDPQALMAFMVKNPGLMPGFDALRAGDIGSRRKEVGEYLQGCWRSCFETGDGTGVEATDNTVEEWSAEGDDYLQKPFVADCLIANPPSFAHIHIAEKMGIPLHIMFTMPYSPTQAFPHPLANIQSSNADTNLTNYISYAMIEMLTWQGLGDIINRFRQRSLGLDDISMLRAPGMLQRLKIPHTYCWSPALIAKPKDWGANVNISGFFFLDLATNYTPEPDLKAFLDAGDPPVYIGFGSIVLDNPTEMTKLIFDAVRKSGQRALVSKGWGGVGADELGKPDDVFMLGNVPHDWLFKHVSCVVHHGGAGTTAAGITAGRPTVVVPFFGDQMFWGSMVARAGAGPDPIPNKELTADKLAEAIKFCLELQSQERAHELAASIATEKGSDLGAQSFHQFLDVDKMRCSLAPSRPAVWRIKRTQARLSAMAACTLAQEGLLDFNDLKLFRAREYEADDGPWDPITGGATALVGTMSTMMLGVADFPIETLKALKIHPDAQKKKSNSDGKKAEGADSSDQSLKSRSTGLSSKESLVSGTSSPAMTPRTTSETTIQSAEQVASPPASRSGSSFNVQESIAKLNTGPLSPGSEQGSTGSRSDSQPPKPKKTSSFSNVGGNLLQTATDTSKGVNRIVGAGFKSPMDFTMNLTRGFHNAPKLYGDETVRKHDKVTDLKSGIRAATKEFGFGMYDGITGLVTQPMKGASKEGAAGFMKGIGKGIGGIALKPAAAIFAIPGYTMKGVYKELQKNFGSSVNNYIVAARTAQGFDEFQAASPEERADVVMRWNMLHKDLKKKRNPDELVRDILAEQMRKKEAWLDSRMPKGKSASGTSTTSMASSSQSSLSRGQQQQQQQGSTPIDPETAEQLALEEAIRVSVRETSEGDADKDAQVEAAIRASMADVQRNHRLSSSHPDDEDSMRRAIEESEADAERHRHERQAYDEELERALAQSLKEQRGWSADNDSLLDTRSILSEQTLAEEHHNAGGPPPRYDPGHLAGTTQQEWEGDGGGREEKSQQEKTEEEIVLEYIKKQSLLEEKAREGKGGGGDEDEELKRALELSKEDKGGPSSRP